MASHKVSERVENQWFYTGAYILNNGKGRPTFDHRNRPNIIATGHANKCTHSWLSRTAQRWAQQIGKQTNNYIDSVTAARHSVSGSLGELEQPHWGTNSAELYKTQHKHFMIYDETLDGICTFANVDSRWRLLFILSPDYIPFGSELTGMPGCPNVNLNYF
ncbi:hypothetical protein HDV00_001879 [Rhizophlyctis rosea]|nr:hypothetical protein HDV00_001879 [Rhizophlyctis rosea]